MPMAFAHSRNISVRPMPSACRYANTVPMIGRVKERLPRRIIIGIATCHCGGMMNPSDGATAERPTPSGKQRSAETATHRTTSRARSAGAVFAKAGARTSPRDSPTTLGGTSAKLYATL